MQSEILSQRLDRLQQDRTLLEYLAHYRSARSFRAVFKLLSFGTSVDGIDITACERVLRRAESKVQRRLAESLMVTRSARRKMETGLLEFLDIALAQPEVEQFTRQRWKVLVALKASSVYQRMFDASNPGRVDLSSGEKQVASAAIGLISRRLQLMPPPDIPAAGFKVVVYTCVVGGWDKLIDPEEPLPGVDYFVFTDRPMVDLEVWQQVPINFSHADTTKIARFYKTHSRWFFPDYRFAVWVDGNISLSPSILNSIAYMRSNEISIGAISHPLRQCLYDEAQACVVRGKGDEGELRDQIDAYREAQVPEGLGLFETGVMIFSHFDEKAAACASLWWNDISKFSNRDQVSLPVALSRSGLRIHEIVPVGQTVRTGNGFSLQPHAASAGQAQYIQDSTGVLSVEPASTVADAIVPIFNNPEMTIACIEELRSYERIGQILLIDDFSETENRRKIVEYAAANGLDLTLNEQNLGYTTSVNRLFPRVQAPCVFLVNTDAVPDHDAMDQCVSVLFSRAEMGAVGPLSNAASFQSIPHLKTLEGRFATNSQLLDVDAATVRALLEEFFGTQDYLFAPLLNGFFYCIKTKALGTVGGFDVENFRVFGEENDFIFRVQDAGYQTAIACKAYIPHNKAAGYRSVNYDVQQAKKRAGVNLRQKWGQRVQSSEAAFIADQTLIQLRTFLQTRLEVEP